MGGKAMRRLKIELEESERQAKIDEDCRSVERRWRLIGWVIVGAWCLLSVSCYCAR